LFRFLFPFPTFVSSFSRPFFHSLHFTSCWLLYFQSGAWTLAFQRPHTTLQALVLNATPLQATFQLFKLGPPPLNPSYLCLPPLLLATAVCFQVVFRNMKDLTCSSRVQRCVTSHRIAGFICTTSVLVTGYLEWTSEI
jgi:hypothetical protein